MAKKIRFPLVLAEGAQVRSIEELREHFNLEAVLRYYNTDMVISLKSSLRRLKITG